MHDGFDGAGEHRICHAPNFVIVASCATSASPGQAISADTIESSRMNRIVSGATLIICSLVLNGAGRAEEAKLPLNPAVTQATITDTVCVPGWTKNIRPYVGEMRIIKAEMLVAIGESHEHRNRYQLDQRIPLALEGATIDRRNLILQPVALALEKDAIERCLAVAVCDGRLGLDEARSAIWRDWRAAGTVCETAAGNPGAFD